MSVCVRSGTLRPVFGCVALLFRCDVGCGRDSLVARFELCAGEGVGSVAGSVVGDDPLDSGDAMCGEPGSRAVHRLL